jgi:hypothetical protein
MAEALTFIIKCIIFIFYHLYLTILSFSLVFFCFASSRANVSHGVAKEGLTWAKDGHRFICKVETYNTSYFAKYLLVKHLQ